MQDGWADQLYDPAVSDPRTDAAVDYIWGNYVLRSGSLFAIQYCGHSSLDAVYRCPIDPGRMPQYGTYYLARDKGWDWQQIIHYYWDPVGIIAPGFTRSEQTDTHLSFTGTWGTGLNPGASGGSWGYTNTSGASVTVKFTGTSIGWITVKSPNYGIAQVTLDSDAPVTVDLYSPDTKWQQKVWSATGLTDGTHTLTIAYTGTKNPAAGWGLYRGRRLRHPGDDRPGGRSASSAHPHPLPADRHPSLLHRLLGAPA